MKKDVHLPQSLRTKINEIHNRFQCAWVMRNWVRFGCITLGLILFCTVLLYLATLWEISRLWPVLLFAVAEVTAFWYYLVHQNARPITRQQIALYIEEHYPDMENRIISAVGFESGAQNGISTWMIDQFFDDTDRFVKRLSFSELLDLDLLTKLFVISTVFLFVSGVIVVLFHSLWFPSLSPYQTEQVTLQPVYDFSVEPGNAKVRKGDNQVVLCTSADSTRQVSLQWRSGDQPWQDIPMQASTSDNVFYHTFSHIQNDIQYIVHGGGRQSEMFTLRVWEPPAVESIDVVYTYPDYLGLEPKESPNAGSITAIEGTRIQVTAWVNKKLQSAELVFDSSQAIALSEKTDFSWAASFSLIQNDRFTITLLDEEGEVNEFSPTYEITVQQDLPPEISLDFPRDDIEANMLEEIPVEFHVRDDYGLSEYGLLYEIAGRDPVRIPLHGVKSATSEIKAGHWLRLEELAVEPGDVITWTVWAKDRKPDRNAYEELGDPFFIEIRPFRRMYEEAMSNAGANQNQNRNQQQGNNQDAATQKDIIIATWNLRKNAKNMDDEEFDSQRRSIVQAQIKVGENVTNTNAVSGGKARLVQQLSDAIQQSVDELKAADMPDPSDHLSKAMVHQQKAYRLILKLQPDTSQVQQQLAQRGRGRGSRQNRPDISELELDRKRNFYEEENRPQQELEQSNEAIDNIKNLARRQKAVNQEIAKLLSELKKESSPEELKRQLERLQEEERRNLDQLDEMERRLAMNDMRDPRTREALQRLNEVRDQMNRSLEQMEGEQLQQARVSGNRAVRALDRMEEEFKQLSRSGAAQQMVELQEQMEQLVQKEKSILDQIQSIRDTQDQPSLTIDPELDNKKETLQEDKEQVAQAFKDTMTKAGELAERSQRSQGLLSRRLGDWMRETSRKGIYEDMQREQRMPLIRYGIWDSARELEEQILDKLTQASTRLDELAQSMVSSDLEAMQLALENLKDLLQPGRRNGLSDAEAQAAGGQIPGASALALNREDQNQGEPSPGQQEQQDQQGQGRRGQSSQQPGPGQGQQSQQPGQGRQGQAQQPQGQEPGNQGSSGQNAQAGQSGQGQGSGEGGRRFGGGGPGGDFDQWPLRDEILSPEAMRPFIESDYRNWLESLRNAEQLLPGESRTREQVSTIREQIEEMRRAFRSDADLPKYDLFLEVVAGPLLESARQLDEEIQAILAQEEYVFLDEGHVPDQYQDQVAEYFKTLSEVEAR